MKTRCISLRKLLLNVVDGRMQYLFDENGRRYLDAFGGIATVSCGHCHPDIVNAIVKQTQRIQHSTILYLNSAIADFAEALASKLPGNLKVVFFTNSGTEANELALMMAKLYTGCQNALTLTYGSELIGMQRDWNEELQSCREFPHTTAEVYSYPSHPIRPV